MSSQYDELQPTNGSDRLAILGHPSKFQRVSRHLGSVPWFVQQHWTEGATCVRLVCVCVLLWCTIFSTPIFGRAAITCYFRARSSSWFYSCAFYGLCVVIFFFCRFFTWSYISTTGKVSIAGGAECNKTQVDKCCLWGWIWPPNQRYNCLFLSL